MPLELIVVYIVAGGICGAAAVILANSQPASKEADRRAGEALVSLLDEAGRREIEALAARGERVRAIRRIRDLTGLGLPDTRRIYEALRR